MERRLVRIFVVLVLSAFLALPSLAYTQVKQWITKADMNTPRWGLGSAVVDGKVYAIGGSRDARLNLLQSTVEEYDPVTDTWITKSDMPTARSKPAIAAVGGKVYVLGGEGNGVTFRAVEEYDPVTDTWAIKSDMPRSDTRIAVTTFNGKIYLFGGQSSRARVDEYDPATDTWIEKARMPTGRLGPQSGISNGKIYVFGGWTFSNNNAPLTTLEVYDPITDIWEAKPDMPDPAAGFGLAEVGGKFYIIGGVRPGGWSDLVSSARVASYDPITQIWTQESDLTQQRRNLAVSAVRGKIYAIGGSDFATGVGIQYAITEEFDTGFVPSTVSVNPKGKLATTWATIKHR